MQSKPFKITLVDKYTIIISDAIGSVFNDKKQSRVRVEVSNNDKKISYYAALKKIKTGGYKLYFSNAKQKELAIEIGDTFTMQLFEDKSKYGVEMPESLDAVLLSDYDAFEIFETLTPGKQRSIIYQIKRYKNIQTQVDKSIILTTNLKRGLKDLKLLLKSN